MGTKIKLLILLTSLPHLLEGIRPPFIITTNPIQRIYPVPPTPIVKPVVTSMHVFCNISNRFSNTLVTSHVKNPSGIAQETTYNLILPDEAYISSMIMEVDGKTYVAYVEEKGKAKRTYSNAVSNGQGAAVIASVRDSNVFAISLNIEAFSDVTLSVTYEELLQRISSHYTQVINVQPGQLVDDLYAEVQISEERPIIYVNTDVRSGKTITPQSPDLKSIGNISKPSNNSVEVTFKPNTDKQKLIARSLGTDESLGVAGQFVVEYEVEREPYGGEVLLNNGHMVHFFARSDLQPLKKHIVIIVDTSGSMWGNKISQLKDAMKIILGSLKAGDLFSVIDFNTVCNVWNLDAPSENTHYPEYPKKELSEIFFPPAYPVTTDNYNKALQAVLNMEATGSTNIYDALMLGCHLIDLHRRRTGDDSFQSNIFFLTDGIPNVAVSDFPTIIRDISEANSVGTPIMTLAFGNDADVDNLEKLSLANHGYSTKIYEDSDAALQMTNFFNETTNPMLRNLKFVYTPDVVSMTITEFPVYYLGSEIVVVAKVLSDNLEGTIVNCIGPGGPIIYRPRIFHTVGQLERLWAYLTVKKYIEQAKIDEESSAQYNAKALTLALKYFFVTPLTSLVVVKPTSTFTIDPIEIDNSNKGLQNIGGASIFPTSKWNGGGGLVMDDVDDSSPILPTFGTATTKQPITATLPPNIKQQISWLESTLNPDNTLSFLKGRYTLGYNATSPSDSHCTTPYSKPGYCKLLKDCMRMSSCLKDKISFLENFCSIDNQFAGVCCPLDDIPDSCKN